MATRKITERTKVKTISNTVGSVAFRDANGRKVRYPKQEAIKTVTVGDLLELYSHAPKMLEEGIILIEDIEIREHIGLDYSNIIAYKDIDKFLEQDAKTIKEVLKDAPATVKMNVAQTAKDKKLDSASKQKAIKEATGLDVSEDEE